MHLQAFGIRSRATAGSPPPYRFEDEGGHPHRADRLKHLRDDDLVLYQDGEIRTAPAERHLHVCRGCRDRLQALDLQLSRLTFPPATGAPPPPPNLPLWRRVLRRLVRRNPRPD
jgi:hypothetical protein